MREILRSTIFGFPACRKSKIRNLKSAGVFAIIASFAVCGALAQAQPPAKPARIGLLVGGSRSSFASNLEAFRQGLRELGYVEGKNISIEYRYAEGKLDHLRGLADELVRHNVDIIVTQSTLDAYAARQSTSTTPIVMTASGDAVGTGLIASLARPGGNITGLTALSRELSGKRLELLKEVIPGLARVAILWNAANPDKARDVEETQHQAKALGLELQLLEVRDVSDFPGAFQSATRKRAGALLILADSLTSTHQGRIVELAAKSRLPAMHEQREFVEAGGLMAYGPNIVDLFRRVATYVDKILKGTKPADLPVEQPTQFELVLNLKTAKTIGVTIPAELLVRATKVIK
ncbi:MAG TPA: ABC transporter substrate-binding protein [Candidatus Acidoferrales bacterium]|nr:ABC transporter substrate-binding protein [Candidatus Acidoferrales bacterium]